MSRRKVLGRFSHPMTLENSQDNNTPPQYSQFYQSAFISFRLLSFSNPPFKFDFYLPKRTEILQFVKLVRGISITGDSMNSKIILIFRRHPAKGFLWRICL